MTEMKSFMDFETKDAYSKLYLDDIRQYLEMNDIRENRDIGEYFIKKWKGTFFPRMKDGYALFEHKTFSQQEIALALHYTSESERYFSPGRTKVASILPKNELEKIVNDTDKKVALIEFGKLPQKEKIRKKEKNKC